MGKIPHCFEPGCWYFITTTTVEFKPYFNKHENAKIVINLLYNLQEQNKTRVDEFVIMPDHIHVILIPHEKTLAEVVRDLKRGSARLINLSESIKDRSIWIPNYRDDKIFDEQDLEAKRKYIWYNPVKKGFSTTPFDYPYSTANIEIRQRFGLSI